MAQKKIVSVEGKSTSAATASTKTESKPQEFKIDEASKKKALTFRIFAILSWLIAIGLEVVAIMFLKKTPINMTMLIVFIALDLAFAVCGSMLWKKSNRLDPASEKNKTKFFIQNQLGAFMGVIAFLPLVVLIFMNKDIDKKQKTILGTIAVVALGVAGFTGVDTAPPSIEQYAEQTSAVEQLMGENKVYWTESGTRYHLYSDCYTINKDTTVQIYEGTVANAREIKNITELCKICESKAEKQGGSAAEIADVAKAESSATESAAAEVSSESSKAA